MTDTLPDAPPPATLRDPRPRRVVVAVVAVLVAALAAAAIWLYFGVWRYDAVARRHVPGNANLVVRLEAADVALFGPVRKRLVPLLVDHVGRSGKKRGDRIREATGVALATDVREIIVASVDATSWVLIAGGHLARGHFIDGLATLARDEGWGFTRDGELLLAPGGFAIAQAEDGALVIGTDRGLVTAALPATDDERRLALPERGAVTFAVTRQAWSGAAGILAAAHAGVLGRVERASGQLVLGAAPEVKMTLEPARGVDAAALAAELSELVADLRLVSLLLPDVAGEKEALGSARITPSGDRVAISAPWPYEGLDRACQRLAGLLGGGTH